MSLENLSKYLEATKKAIEDRIETLEKGRKLRDLKRKELLALEIKQLLAAMAKNDTKIMKDLKGEAFDMLQSLNKIFAEASSKKNEMDLNESQEVENLKNKVNGLGVEEFLRSLDVTVSTNSGLLVSTVEKLSDAVFLSSTVLNPQHFFLQLPEKQLNFQPGSYNCNYVSINIFSGSEDIRFSPLLMRNLNVEVMGHFLEQSKGNAILEETTVLAKMEIKKATISEDKSFVTVQLKRPSDGLVRISVKVLGSNIVNSPVIYEFTGCHSDKDASQVNDTLGIFDMTGLDESDLVSLDMTRRKEMLLNVGKRQLLINSSLISSPAYQRKVSKQPNMSSVPEVPSLDQHSQLELGAAVLTLPLVNPVQEEEEVSCDEDPHIMLNASKAPSPQSARCWQKEDSVWDQEAELEQHEESDPHLMIAASDPSWSNTSMLPDTQIQVRDANQTVWGEEILEIEDKDKIDFLTCSMEVENVFKSHKIAETNSRGPTYCLESPCSVAFLPLKQSFLVTEPAHNRIGLYEGGTFQFAGWLAYPPQAAARSGRFNYNYPTSVLVLGSGEVVLLEKDQLHIFDGEVRYLHSIKGVFYGLAEGAGGEIFTLVKNKHGLTFLNKMSRETPATKFKISGQLRLKVIETFNDWKTLSKVRFLIYSQGRVLITDLGLHKLYIVDLSTGEQTASGYMGSKMGHIKKPTGLAADEWGNVVVGDSDNNRLVVFNKSGELVKIIQHQGPFFFPTDLLRVEGCVLAVYMATKDSEQGAVVRYKLVPGSQV